MLRPSEEREREGGRENPFFPFITIDPSPPPPQMARSIPQQPRLGNRTKSGGIGGRTDGRIKKNFRGWSPGPRRRVCLPDVARIERRAIPVIKLNLILLFLCRRRGPPSSRFGRGFSPAARRSSSKLKHSERCAGKILLRRIHSLGA